MDAAIRHLVRQRAEDCCEHCRLPQEAIDARFHVEHISQDQHGEKVSKLPGGFKG